ncbi:MAG TPA: hypothetical protein VNM39_10705 [Verrucomicrobiae bacterium]|nr:hypothetical protein [Verrucomicrobiae bacterium]
MPYIDQDARLHLAITYAPRTAGELNYLISLLIARFVKSGPLNYERLNAAMGAHVGAGREFYRRVVVPYEERKMRSNGDIEW